MISFCMRIKCTGDDPGAATDRTNSKEYKEVASRDEKDERYQLPQD